MDFWAVSDIASGRRPGALWALLALLFGAVGKGPFLTDLGILRGLIP